MERIAKNERFGVGMANVRTRRKKQMKLVGYNEADTAPLQTTQ